MRNHSSRQSKKFLLKRRMRMIIWGVAVLGVLSLGLFLLSFFSSLKFLEITTVRISGIDADRVELMHDSVMDSLQGNYLGMFARSNTIIYPKRSLRRMIQDSFLEVDSVKIQRDGLHTLTVTAEERDLAAVVCAKFPDFVDKTLSLDDPGDCYFADAAGFIFKKAPSFTGSVYNRYYIPELRTATASSTDTLVGQYATSTTEFSLVQNVYAEISAQGIHIDAVLMKANGEYELYARNPLLENSSDDSHGSTVVIYLNTSQSPEEQVSNLVTFWTHMVKESRMKNVRLEFDYIDARYGDNVFYREVK